MTDTTAEAASFTLGHTSDWHLGYEAYRATSPSGNNQRGQDIVRAVMQVVADIVAYDPPIAVVPGDVIDRPQVPIKYMLIVRQQLEKLASVRADGTRRQVVVSSGNHDQPRNLTEACFLELFKGLPGVHVVTSRYEQVEFPDAGQSAGRDDVLADVVVHVLPHDQLKRVEWGEVRPIEGKVNILAAHGVAGGSELYIRSLGREFAVPTDVLNRDWDYGALGHWHKRTAVNDRVWYCGSPENVSFRDLRDNGDRRGYLQVTVNPGDLPEVAIRDLPIRRMFRLPEFDASGMDADEITAELTAKVKATDLSGAVVAQVVTGVSRDRWALVDKTGIRNAAGDALHFDIVARYAARERSEGADGETAASDSSLSDVDALLAARGTELLGDEAPPAVALATKLVSEELDSGLEAPHASSEHPGDDAAVTAESDDGATSAGSGGGTGPDEGSSEEPVEPAA